jgi:hypothetical protein
MGEEDKKAERVRKEMESMRRAVEEERLNKVAPLKAPPAVKGTPGRKSKVVEEPEPSASPVKAGRKRKAEPEAVKEVPKKKKVVQPRTAQPQTSGSAGGGRMIQAQVDYLSQRRLKIYDAWKSRILERCDQIDRGEVAAY